ncbi:MAG: 2-hydroxyacid dehydrogenase [Deltaproteobacteria bacterium]|jgi:phosphoglycerate dehydrogenase-like enzyme|nr:2-hydroxyacid dehydrogenase [Deltaproteobacteria bacterium]
MKILFAAPESAWGGFLGMLRAKMPEHHFEATGQFGVESLAGAHVLIPTMALITKETLATQDRLRLVQQCGSGLESVDVVAAKKMGIRVANVPTDISGNADSVAELAIYLMIGLSRKIHEAARRLEKGLMGEPQGMALRGRTVGIVGLGGIGRALALRLKPFGVKLLGIKRSDPAGAKDALGLDWAGGPGQLHEMLSKSHYVVLCLPVTPESANLMDHNAFSAMKPGAFLINVSRGGLVDRNALAHALSNNLISGAGLDVFWEEPPDPDDPILGENVLVTPHIAGSTDVSMRGIVAGVAENIRRIEQGKEPLNAQ